MLTPGRNRGQQGTAVQRDSPMGLLQQLGRQLAPTTRPIESSSPRDSISSSVPRPRRPTALAQEVDDDEDPELPEMQAEDESEPELTRPRLSLPINDDDDDDDTLPIPQPSEVPYDTSMNQASERGRRTTYGRPPRISGISAPGSEFADETGEPSDFLGLFENVQAGPGVDTSYYHEEDSRRETIGGQSEIALPMPVGYEDQSTFQMSEADPALGQTSPILPENARAGNAARGDVTGNVTLAVDDDLDDHDGGAAFDGGAGDYDAMPYVEELSRAGSSRRVSRIEPLDEEDDELELAFEQPRRRSSVREAQSLLRAPGRGRPKGSVTRKKVKKLSQLGAEYPPLPPNFVKRVAQRALQNSSLNNPRISADVVTALTQASDWFFEQMGDDLGAYAEHAGRDAIDDADVITLMRRYVEKMGSRDLNLTNKEHIGNDKSPTRQLCFLWPRDTCPESFYKRFGCRCHSLTKRINDFEMVLILFLSIYCTSGSLGGIHLSIYKYIYGFCTALMRRTMFDDGFLATRYSITDVAMARLYHVKMYCA